MRKRGRPTYYEENRLEAAILNLLTVEPPGRSFTDLVTAANELGFSKSTFWRYLRKFMHLGVVLHEGKCYRLNPLFGYRRRVSESYTVVPVKYPTGESKILFSSRFGLFDHLVERMAIGTCDFVMTYDDPGDPFKSAQSRQRLLERTLDFSRYAEGSDHWLDVWRRNSLGSERWNGDTLRRRLDVTIRGMVLDYLRLLERIIEAPTLSVARELANVIIEHDMKTNLMSFARECWDRRKHLSLADLAEMQLAYTIHYEREPIHWCKREQAA